MFENHASLRVATLSPGVHEDYSDWPSSATRFWVANWRQSSMKSPSFRSYLDEGLFESLQITDTS